MRSYISFTKKQAGFAALGISVLLVATVSVGAGAAFIISAFVVLTA